MRLQGKHIILGITGSIAAYKAAFLTRLLIKEGAQVKIIMTPYAKEFITPVTMATLSQNTVLCDFFHHDDGAWNSHVELGLLADLMLIAPATANTIAKMAVGIADNLLLTTYLSARCPVMIAPAMDMDMYAHPATQENIRKLTQAGVLMIEPATGELASTLQGKGRMEEPEQIIIRVVDFFMTSKKKIKKKILITAGPTYEPIDKVRFIGNHSTGKMGVALAGQLVQMGAEVTMIAGPLQADISRAGIRNVVHVTTAAQMKEKCLQLFPLCDIAILAAAVADYTPAEFCNTKIKRTAGDFVMTLKPTDDIAALLGKMKKPGQKLIGFALEAENEIENAKAKCKRKNFDFIVLNSLNDPGAGFGCDTNKISIIDNNGKITEFPLKTKDLVASDIAGYLFETFQHE